MPTCEVSSFSSLGATFELETTLHPPVLYEARLTKRLTASARARVRSSLVFHASLLARVVLLHRSTRPELQQTAWQISGCGLHAAAVACMHIPPHYCLQNSRVSASAADVQALMCACSVVWILAVEGRHKVIMSELSPSDLVLSG